MGLHLFPGHGITDPNGFEENYKFAILENLNPGAIEKKEFMWMH